MARRLLHTLISFIVVFVAFALYRFLLAPLMLPDKIEQTFHPRASEIAATPPQIKRLAEFFDAGEWESQQPIVIEKPEFAVLLKNYESTPDDQLRINPCTFIFFPEGRPENSEKKPVVILRAPEGAILDFEGGCDLARAKIGKLQGGRLLGEVSISNRDPQNDPEKDFSLVTRDVELREDRLWSRQDVIFQFGKNKGQGRGLQIQFDLDPQSDDAEDKSGFQTVQRVDIFENVRLSLNLPARPLLPRDPFSSTASNKAAPPLQETLVEVKCRGRFRWNSEKMIARLEDQVDVTRHHLTSPPDKMTCDRLEIHFEENLNRFADEERNSPSIGKNIEPIFLIADGSPVQMTTPTWQATARGNHLEVDLRTQRLLLQGEQPVRVTHQQSSLIAMDIDYRPGEQNDLGTLRAVGPGRLVSASDDGHGAPVEVSWDRTLEMKPEKDGQVISIIGGGRIQHAEASALQAEKIWLWLERLPETTLKRSEVTKKIQDQWIPHSALALENVRMHGEKLSAVSDRLEVWFEQRVGEAADFREAPAEQNVLWGTEQGRGEQVAGEGKLNPNATDSHYHIRGDLIQLTLAISGQSRPTPTAASVSGGVELTERGTELPPITVRGDHLDLFDADTANAVVSLTGQPARATGRAASITGNTLHLERGSGRMWVEGAGAMQVPLNQDLDGNPLERFSLLDVTWNGRMHFDNTTLAFEKDVFARTENQELRTAELKVTLNQQLNFIRPVDRESIDIKQIACLGGVLISNREMTEGQEETLDQLTTTDLTIQQPSGRLTARGPGTLTSIRSATGNPSAMLLAAAPQRSIPEKDQAQKNSINYLKVEFDRGIIGNIHNRELTFLDRVLCTYGPVRHRGETVRIDPTTGPQGNQVIMNCDQLTVRQMGSKKSTNRPVEMEAVGNSHLRGESFSAAGHRLTYTTGKELFVLEGGGDTYAQLSRQTENTPPSNLTAQKIYFWRTENRVQMDGVRLFDGNLPPGEIKP
tara:strand:+ start:7865 stop:10822 length:2958 start_codon:yes stop_codon:yes gene_type:complete